jgi:hypothetical protein
VLLVRLGYVINGRQIKSKSALLEREYDTINSPDMGA